MRVVAFRHVPFEGAGHLESVLREHGIEFQYADLYRADAATPDLSDAAAVVVLGGPMSMNGGLPWLRREQRLVERAVADGMPVLGICLGAQMLAQSLGAKVYRNPGKEIGWFEVHFTEAARDSLFAGMGGAETFFHWHGETFDLPAGAELLAWSDDCRNQAFRWRNVCGVQFHPEVTPEMIADWCRQDENCGDVRELETLPDPAFHSVHLRQVASLIFRRWLNEFVPKTASKT